MKNESLEVSAILLALDTPLGWFGSRKPAKIASLKVRTGAKPNKPNKVRVRERGMRSCRGFNNLTVCQTPLGGRQPLAGQGARIRPNSLIPKPWRDNSAPHSNSHQAPTNQRAWAIKGPWGTPRRQRGGEGGHWTARVSGPFFRLPGKKCRGANSLEIKELDTYLLLFFPSRRVTASRSPVPTWLEADD